MAIIYFSQTVTVGVTSSTSSQGVTTTSSGYKNNISESGLNASIGSITSDVISNTLYGSGHTVKGMWTKNNGTTYLEIAGSNISDSTWTNWDIGGLPANERVPASFTAGNPARWTWSSANSNGSMAYTSGTQVTVVLRDNSVDNVPDQFYLQTQGQVTTSQTNIPRNTYVTSNEIFITGMDSGATGGFLTGGVYADAPTVRQARWKLGAAAWSAWTTQNSLSLLTNVSVGNGDKVQVRAYDDGFNVTRPMYITISNITSTINFTTVAYEVPAISSVTVGNVESANETVTVNLSTAGGGGTGLYYAQSTSTTKPTSGWQTSSQFSHPRGTTRYYFASRYNDGSIAAATTSASGLTVGYLNPKAFTFTVDGNSGVVNFPYSKTSFVCTIAGADTDHTYQLLYGTNSPTTNAGSRTTNGDITVSGGEMVPAGGQMQYRMRVARGTSSGGDGNYIWFGAGPFVRYRYPQTPTASVGFNNPNDNDVTATVTASNTTGASSLAYSNGGTYVAGNTFGAVRGTAANYYVRSTGSNGLTATSAAAPATPAYNAPDAAITAIGAQNLAYGSTTAVFAIAGGSSIDEYFVYNNTGTVNYGSRTGNGNITITHGIAAGGSGTFRVYVRRPIAVGGDNAFDATNVSGVVVKVYPQTPTASVGFNNPNDNDVTATVTGSNTTGAASLAYSNGGTYVAGNTFGAVRGTAANYYVRSTGANGLTATSAAAPATPAYNAPDAAISAIASPEFSLWKYYACSRYSWW